MVAGPCLGIAWSMNMHNWWGSYQDFQAFSFEISDALTQAEKDTGSLKSSVKSNNRQGKKKQPVQKTKTPSSSQSPRQEKDKQSSVKTIKNTKFK